MIFFLEESQKDKIEWMWLLLFPLLNFLNSNCKYKKEFLIENTLLIEPYVI